MITLRERFEEIGVPFPEDLPADMAAMVMKGMQEGRVLMITKVDDGDGVARAEWMFITPPKAKRTEIISDPDLPPPYDHD